MGGFVKVAREFDGVELVGIESPLWPKTGTGSGWVTQEAYETFVGRMIAELRRDGAVRRRLSLRCTAPWPCAACRGPKRSWRGGYARWSGRARSSRRRSTRTATRTRSSCAMPTWRSRGKYFPHYDSHLQGERAARMLVRAIRGDYRPAHVTREGADHLADRAAMDRRVAVDGPGAARAHLGGARAGRLCEFLLRLSLRRRAGCRHDVPGDDQRRCRPGAPGRRRHGARSPGGGARRCWARPRCTPSPRAWRWRSRRWRQGATPVVLADHSDRSGYATWLLKEIIAQDLSDTLIATVADAEADRRAQGAGAKAGDAFDMEVGGLADESAGAPVRISGTVLNADRGAGPALGRASNSAAATCW